jgi:hypothetical protein
MLRKITSASSNIKPLQSSTTNTPPSHLQVQPYLMRAPRHRLTHDQCPPPAAAALPPQHPDNCFCGLGVATAFAFAVLGNAAGSGVNCRHACRCCSGGGGTAMVVEQRWRTDGFKNDGQSQSRAHTTMNIKQSNRKPVLNHALVVAGQLSVDGHHVPRRAAAHNGCGRRVTRKS